MLKRFAGRPAILVFVFCLALGLLGVGWNAKTRKDRIRPRARDEAALRAGALESEFNQALSAAEVLTALARQSGGNIPDFQKTASDLLATRPSLASLELQPGGVVSDIVPRAGQERALGKNVMQDPLQRSAVNAALQSRALTVAGPFALYRGEKGFIARMPIFARGRDGREMCWGFVAVSFRLADVVARARLDGLWGRGYDYQLYLPATSQQRAVSLAARGVVSPESAVEQPVRVRNLDLRLAVEPRGGWISIPRVAMEAAGVLILSGLLCLLVNLIENRRELEAALGEINRRLAKETAERTQAQEGWHAAKDGAAATRAELERLRPALQEAETRIEELKSRLLAAEAAKAQPEANEEESSAPAPVDSPEVEKPAVEVEAPVIPAVVEAPAEPAAAPAVEPPAPRDPAPKARRKKARRDNQMDLFGAASEPAPATTPNETPAATPSEEVAPPSGTEAVESAAAPAEEIQDAPAESAPEPPAAEPEPAPEPPKEKPARALPPSPPVNPGVLRKAVGQILPLLVDQDPGAKDCLKDNRQAFRSAFSPEGYEDFEQRVKKGQYAEALDHLKKAAKRHGISV